MVKGGQGSGGMGSGNKKIYFDAIGPCRTPGRSRWDRAASPGDLAAGASPGNNGSARGCLLAPSATLLPASLDCGSELYRPLSLADLEERVSLPLIVAAKV